MPLRLPDKLPAIELLKEEGIFAIDDIRANSQDIRPLKIAVLNLMPLKIVTETDLVRVLSNTPLQVEMNLLTMDSHESTHISQDHMEAFYRTLDEVKREYFDGMIITGSPVEHLEFEDVDYWDELCDIFEFARTHVYSTMFICWGAQAALKYYYGIEKYPLDQKLFGVFEHTVERRMNPLMRGFDDIFYAPHSRHTAIKREDIEKEPELRILAGSDIAGPHIVSTENGRQIFVFGHQEYDRDTLAAEYFRDLDKGLDIQIPCNYFIDDDPKKGVLFRWRSHGNLLFSNWLNYYLYQATPYNLDDLRDGKADAWRATSGEE